jgi:hypothetical protein
MSTPTQTTQQPSLAVREAVAERKFAFEAGYRAALQRSNPERDRVSRARAAIAATPAITGAP